jgi:hypothetical protein
MSRGNIISLCIGAFVLVVLGVTIPPLGLVVLLIAAIAAVVFPLANRYL